MGERDVGFIDDTPNLILVELEFQLVLSIQNRTDFCITATNGAHRISWSIYYGENWATNYETWYTDYMTKLFKESRNIIKVPRTRIMFQPVTVNIYYPKEKE
jgi:hypothetical protein